MFNILNPMVNVCPIIFNGKTSYILLTEYSCVLYVFQKENNDFFPLQHKLTGFFNRDEKCLQRGTDWVFK